MFITMLDHPEYSETYNRCDGYHHPVVLHASWARHFGRFPSMQMLKKFLDFAGLKMTEITEERHMGKCGMYRQWNVAPIELKETGFSDMREIPEDAKAFTGLSNGRLVTCYLKNDGKTLRIYRPNPNIESLYKPLSVEEHIQHCRENGYV